jgi:hypothetical protein
VDSLTPQPRHRWGNRPWYIGEENQHYIHGEMKNRLNLGKNEKCSKNFSRKTRLEKIGGLGVDEKLILKYMLYNRI